MYSSRGERRSADAKLLSDHAFAHPAALALCSAISPAKAVPIAAPDATYRQGDLRVPEDGPVSWTTRADLAETDAAILAGHASFEGVSPPLTAMTAITMAEMAEIASEVTEKDVRHTTVTDEEWRSAKIASGMPEFYAEMLLGTFRAARRGDFASTSPVLGTLLGRKPVGMREVLVRHLTR